MSDKEEVAVKERPNFDARRYRNERRKKSIRSSAGSRGASANYRRLFPRTADGRYLPLGEVESKHYEKATKEEVFVGKVKIWDAVKNAKGKQRVALAYIALSICFILTMGIYFVGRFAYVYLTHKNYDKNNLSEVLKRPKNFAVGGAGMVASTKGEYFVFRDSAEDNYVYYSGNLYRILRLNYDGSVMLISDDAVGVSIFNGKNEDFQNTEIYRWLNVVDRTAYSAENILNNGIYYNSLYKPEEFLVPDTKFCVLTDEEGICQKEIEAPVGLLSIEQYLESGAMNSFLNNYTFFWTLSKDKKGDPYLITEDGSLLATGRAALIVPSSGIRPVIVLKANTSIIQGNGSIETPYFVADEEYLAKAGETRLNQRYAGEYVMVGEELFRIIEPTPTATKLLQVGVVGGDDPIARRYSQSTRVSNMFKTSDDTSLAYYLNNTYLQSLKQKELFVKGTSYIGVYSDNSGYRYSELFQSSVRSILALPKIGELYNVNNISESGYWCLDVFNLDGYMMTVLNLESKIEYVVTNQKREVRITGFIDPAAVIVSGNGTIDDPYLIK